MAKWDVELCCGIGFTVTGVDGNTREEAIENAKKLVLDNTTLLTDSKVDPGDLEFEQCTFIQKK